MKKEGANKCTQRKKGAGLPTEREGEYFEIKKIHYISRNQICLEMYIGRENM